MRATIARRTEWNAGASVALALERGEHGAQ
jgi:hypothetical protein